MHLMMNLMRGKLRKRMIYQKMVSTVCRSFIYRQPLSLPSQAKAFNTDIASTQKLTKNQADMIDYWQSG
jgi:hypothetical protein